MDVLLVNAPVRKVTRHARLSPPLGLAYIGAVLLEAGYDVSALDLNVTAMDEAQLRQTLASLSPRILGISTYTETYLSGLIIAGLGKEVNPETTVVIGGPHATVLHQEVAGETGIDVVVRGEGERTMLELADCLIRGKGSLAEVKGITYGDSGLVRTTGTRLPINDPDELPLPARHLFSFPVYGYPNTVLTSRGGCPFVCRFCAVNNIWNGKRRFRSPEKVAEEILNMVANGQAEEINFSDDTFTLSREYVIELCHLLGQIRRSIPLRWRCSTRVDLVDEELLREMHSVGCYSIQFGVEAGSQEILDSMGKNMTLGQTRKAVSMALDAGIEVTCSFMFPHPEDTEDTIREQKRFMKELAGMGVAETLAMTTPFPGTYYHQHADELGIKILANSWDEYDCKHLVIATKHLPEAKLQALLQELVSYVGMQKAVND